MTVPSSPSLVPPSSPIITFGAFYNQLLAAMAGAERIFNLLDTQPDVKDVPHPFVLGRIRGEVKFENVTFGYNPARPVLRDISFECHPGQMIALAGATGSGKTTIVSLLARFYQPPATKHQAAWMAVMPRLAWPAKEDLR